MRKHFEIIDILRGLSALAVALFHVRTELWTGWHGVMSTDSNASLWDKTIALFSFPVPFLGEAVMLFFIVSGFCVHYQYAAGRNRLRGSGYAARRWFRIYPPYLAAVGLTIGIELLLARFFGMPHSGITKFIESVLMIQNYPPGEGQLHANPSLWSLPVEMEFYILYPLMVILARKYGVRSWLLVAAVVSPLAAIIQVTGINWLSGNFAEYWILWCGGAYLAERVATGRTIEWNFLKSVIMAISLVAACFSILVSAPFVVRHFIWGIFYFLLIVWCLKKRPFQQYADTVAWSVLIKLGAISYSLYLIHYPLFKFAGAVWVSNFGEKPENFCIPLLFAAAVIPVAYGFYMLIERPSIALARRYSATSKRTVSASRPEENLAPLTRA